MKIKNRLFNRFHKFLSNDNLNMQNNFIFFDTETNEQIIDDKTKKLTLKLGWALYWNREKNIKEYLEFKDANVFWDFVIKKLDECINLILYAHNTEFDFKIVDGYDILIKRGFNLKGFYIEQVRFIMKYIKNKNEFEQTLEIFDTMNYSPYALKTLGHYLGLEKIDIDFKKCSDKELSIYCKNDVEITFLFIKKLIEFLEKYNLSKLKATCGSLSFNIFKHKFYNKESNPIYIHNWIDCIKLERESYKGGICGCFKIGKFKDKLIKLDINSMYPYVMYIYDYPIKLLFYGKENINYIIKNKSIKLTSNEFIKKLDDKKRLFIIKCNITLQEKYAYILSKAKISNVNKSVLMYGKYDCVLTTPEIDFVKKYGVINHIYEIAIYEKSNIFKEFVKFFYSKRIQFKKENPPNLIFDTFCKLILNSLYGKWGMHDSNYTDMGKSKESDFGYFYVMNKENDYIKMQIGNRIFKVEKNEDNAYDSFVAIASHITAYARIYMSELMLKISRDNLYYCDTDCIICDYDSQNKIKKYIDYNNDMTLGKLKIEGISSKSEFIAPKFYEFNNEKKLKGINLKKDKLLYEDNNSATYEHEQFQRFKTSLKNNNLNCQIIKKMEKTVKKQYDKGIIEKNGNVRPYNAKDLKII